MPVPVPVPVPASRSGHGHGHGHGYAIGIVAVLLLGCYEKGKATPRRDDAGVAAAPRDARPDPDLARLAHREPSGPRDPDATIAIAIEAEPASLDALAGDAITQRILVGDVVEGLVCPGPRLADPPVPCLAERVDASADARTYTFHLRAARWHDGAPLAADHVVATFEILRAGGGGLGALLDDLEAVTARDDRTVELRFREARADRLATLARFPIVRPGQGELPLGTGPLRVVRWTRGERIELVRWDGYWGEPAGAARVRYAIAADRAHALRMVRDGDVDVAVQLPVADAHRLARDEAELGWFAYRLPAFLAAIYNARKPALASPEVRRALTMLLDRATIARELLGAAPISGPFPDGDPAIAPAPFDREAARRLLGERRPAATIVVPQGSTTMAKVADIWAADARGIAELDVASVPFADVLRLLGAGEFDIALMSLSTGPELDLAPRLSSTAPREDAWSGIADAELDRLLAAVRTEPDAARRAELRRALHRRIVELAPMAFIAGDVRLGVARRGIGGIAGAPEGRPPPAARLWRAR